ncbi:hypothetical protein DYBT9275_01866 [Dyadobacter sp. CECT 9275]|uniref:3-keto-alpha-glucoside-1,2-lyase/3-keto-2-hydroxy-glucal hydratase domain-containing protein n=1 Tax=Dyadobacter helix TaxID=2822344 RepID=A0A916JC07_9BACT|nr:family 16 glycoside hydrolase [Dyadobacter sp. CECT 9275]CAG4997857.1 hypothetical protein DYBT9275_01866 [Dyadobacter sp. CECT 9275]
MHSFFQKFSYVFLAYPLMVMGQDDSQSYSRLPLSDFSSFEKPASNWSLQGGISILPKTGTKAKLQSGTGILVGNAGETLVTRLKARDLRLSVEFMVSPGAEGAIILPGGSKVLISDSYKQLEPNSGTSGFIGQFPSQNAAKAPGLWQTLELAYDASVPGLAGTARLNTLALNKVIVLEAVYLPVKNQDKDAQSLSFEVTKGTIAFRNPGYQLLESRKPLSLSNLTYKVYSDKWDAKQYSQLDHEGKSEVITQEVTNGMREFHLVYEGNFEVSEAGNYIFTSIYSGPVLTLDIDGKSVLASGESTSQESHTGSVNLSQGTHKFKIHYSRFPWRPSALGLRVEKAGIRAYDLHVLSSLPEPAPKPNITDTPDKKPDMIRSFIQLEGEKYKRTHCISVGSPTGWNYTMDLNRGALLQAWRGHFANVTEMWYERGEPQLLFPNGLTVPVSGKSSFAVLSAPNSAWPDSSDINYLGYKVDAAGYPAYRYAMGAATVTDQLVSGTGGITRTFGIEGALKGPLYALLGAGKKITEVEKGLYQVDDNYYLQLDKNAKAVVRPSAAGQELILPVADKTSYTLFW